MDTISHHASHVVSKVHEGLKKMPLKKTTAVKHMYKAKHIPTSLARDYDEALLRQYHRERALGQSAQVSGGSWRCVGTDFFGLYLGFVWGLQYDKNAPGVCYTNLRTTIRALNLLIQNLYLVFLPDQWAKLAMSGQDILTLGSALYANCQIQQVLAVAPTFLTYQGLGGLFTRTFFGLQGEIPLYYAKMTEATDFCVQGEAAGYLIQLIFNYSI